MSVDATVPPVAAAPPLFARFSRRFRGIFIDWAITLVVIFGALLVVSTIAADSISRALGIAVIAALLLYEPVLVSFTGGTVGHHLTNLRVVDDATGGNLGFLKACARLLIKGLLGWYSFVIIAATRRNQAIHDLVTRSTVQIRDPAQARPGQFVTERIEPAAARMPAPWERVLAIFIYLVLTFVFIAALDSIVSVGLMSARCTNLDYCRGVQKVIELVLDIGLLLAMVAIIAQGWRGKLYGARVRRASR
ncbi:RDD family protein [Bradyrhizobium genosp. P]|uniref:RDD family protein n=1 Tax=Bradyrhizobium genosp. P TaxID=83641 RepID=UPI003CEF25A7